VGLHRRRRGKEANRRREPRDLAGGGLGAEDLAQGLLDHFVALRPDAREGGLHFHVRHDADALGRSLVGIKIPMPPITG
jgi:hypothetical protein